MKPHDYSVRRAIPSRSLVCISSVDTYRVNNTYDHCWRVELPIWPCIVRGEGRLLRETDLSAAVLFPVSAFKTVKILLTSPRDINLGGMPETEEFTCEFLKMGGATNKCLIYCSII